MIETGARSERRRVIIGTAECPSCLVNQGRHSAREEPAKVITVLRRLAELPAAVSPENFSWSWPGQAAVVTSLGVSARFRTLIRNVARSEGLARRPLTVHDTPWHGSKGWQIRDPAEQQVPIKQSGKNPIKRSLMSMMERFPVIGKGELKRERETTLDAWLNSSFPWVNNFRDIYIQHSLNLWGLGITPDPGGKKSSLILESK